MKLAYISNKKREKSPGGGEGREGGSFIQGYNWKLTGEVPGGKMAARGEIGKTEGLREGYEVESKCIGGWGG